MDATMSFYFSIFVFALTYLGIMSEKIPRSICALLGAGLVIYSGLLTQEMALQKCVTALQNLKCFTHGISPSLCSVVFVHAVLYHAFCQNANLFTNFKIQ